MNIYIFIPLKREFIRKGENFVVTVTNVLPKSRAAKVGIAAGDILVSINGNEINDVLDYRFYLAEKSIDLAIVRDGKAMRFSVLKQEYDDIGLEFETPLMDKKHSCKNRCVFCFIDQLPKGMRSSLYFKDDDDRLSFLHGNYITLTNLGDSDIERIIKMRISPVNISVHTTNSELRVKMMKNKRAGEVLDYLSRLAQAGITLCAQIVLCKGLNDGEELMRTMSDLVALYPALESVSVVPAGLTKYRDGLYPLEAFSPEECKNIIKQVESFGDDCLKKYGSRLFYPADELYIKAGISLPDDGFYEEYAQIQNGVGMITDMRSSFEYELDDLSEYTDGFCAPRSVSVATGYAAYSHISDICKRLEEAVDGLKINVYPIKNEFFGEQITVAGLLTGKDIAEQLSDKELGDALLFPAVCLRAEGDVFLDDMTPEELSKKLGVKCIPTGSDPCEFISAALGII